TKTSGESRPSGGGRLGSRDPSTRGRAPATPADRREDQTHRARARHDRGIVLHGRRPGASSGSRARTQSRTQLMHARALLTCALLLATACETKRDARDTSAGVRAFRVALLTPGPVSDQSWNGGAY